MPIPFNTVKFTASIAGIDEFNVDCAVPGYCTPAEAKIPNGTIVSYTALSPDLSQWEIGSGVYTAGDRKLKRTIISASTNSNDRVHFVQSPTVLIGPAAETFKARELPVNVKAFGAIGDGRSHPLSERFGTLAAAQAIYPHADSLNNEIDWAAIQSAVNIGNRVYIPAGFYILDKGVSQTEATENFELFGDGVQSHLFRKNGTVTGSWQIMFQIRPSKTLKGHLWIVLHDLSFDNNARGNPFGEGERGFAWEQSSTFRTTPRGEKSVSLYAYNLWFNDPIADCINCASGSDQNTFNRLYFRNIHNALRERARFDITITGSFDKIVASDLDLTTFRIEINRASIHSVHDLVLANSHFRRQLSVPISSSLWPEYVRKPVHLISNVRVEGNLSCGGAVVRADNLCVYAASRSRLLRGDFYFRGGEWTWPANFEARAGIESYGARVTLSRLEFDGVTFRAEDGAVFGNSMVRTGSPVLSGDRRVIFRSCEIHLKNNSFYSCRDVLLSVLNTNFYSSSESREDTLIRSEALVDTSQLTEWELRNNRFYDDNVYILDPSRRDMTIRMSGNIFANPEKIWNLTGRLIASDFYADRADPSGETNLIQTPEMDDFELAALPQSGLFMKGQRVKLIAPAKGGAAEYVNTTTGTSPTWQVSRQAGVVDSIASTPDFLGQIAIVRGESYIAVGTSSARDWKRITK